MPSVSTLVNGVRQKIAGRALMDVAFSNTSTNGVQNKVIKAKFDEITTFEVVNGTGTTVGDNIHSFATVFNSLTNEQKFKSYITITAGVHTVKMNCNNINGFFGCITQSSSGVTQILSASISNGTWYASNVAGNAINTLDYSTNTNSTVAFYYPVAIN